MPQDADDGEDHTREIAICVADEDAGGEPVVGEEAEGDADEGEEKVDAEAVGVGGWVVGFASGSDVGTVDDV